MSCWPRLALAALSCLVAGVACSSIDAADGGGVTGVVTCDGAAVEGVAIVPRSLDTPRLAIPEMSGRTDQQGRYAWSLPAGNYEISVWPNGYRRAVKQVSVKSGAFVTLDFSLERDPQQ